jgi:hypothetical protein
VGRQVCSEIFDRVVNVDVKVPVVRAHQEQVRGVPLPLGSEIRSREPNAFDERVLLAVEFKLGLMNNLFSL